MRMFTLSDEYAIVCKSESTRYGFRHLATLLKNGYEVAKNKCTYYNRTWEAYEFETVMLKAINSYFTGDEHKLFRDKIKGVNTR